jgi:ankyrin repeat protein
MRFIVQSPLLFSICALAGCVDLQPATDLARAAHRGDVRTVRLLLTGAITAPMATVALHWAARGGHPAGPHHCNGESDVYVLIVDALIDAGANVNARDGRPDGIGRSSGWTPLHVAVHHKQWALARLLLEHGADAELRSDEGVTPTLMAAWAHAEGELFTSEAAPQTRKHAWRVFASLGALTASNVDQMSQVFSVKATAPPEAGQDKIGGH